METYYKQYEELQEIMLGAYVDIFILDGLEQYNKSLPESNTSLIKDSFMFMNHIAGLCKDDLGISLIKLFEDGNSSTLKTMNSIVHKECQRLGLDVKTPKIKLNDAQLDVFERLKTIRNRRLAHNDSERSNTEVDLSEMKELLECFREMLNGLCVPELDNRIIQITDDKLNGLRFRIMLGEGYMLENSRVANNIITDF